ncbi:MAG: hypothetical protein MJZ99_04750 [Bacteroidales bacterium]|nr:hypothetical protein [Bacteroidales bacterium]
MAKLFGIGSNLVGSAGDWTFSQQGGKTIAKQKIVAKGNTKRSFGQMRHSVQLANLVSLYRAFGGLLHPSFENRRPDVSDYNEFISANLGIIPVYMTKSDARQGGAVVAGYQITRGSLPSIVVSDGMGGEPVTDINMGGITIGATTTVKEFSDAVVQNNRDYQNGDEITVFIAEQYENIETHVPYVKVLAQQITLDQSDSVTKVRSLVGAGGFSIVDGNLAASSSIDGGIAWVHSRKTPNGTKVSTQRLKVTNSYLANYQTPEALDAAVKSYAGQPTEQYLTPDVD